MDGFGTSLLNGSQDGIHIQVAILSGGRANTDSFISHQNVGGSFVGIGIDRHRLYAHFF